MSARPKDRSEDRRRLALSSAYTQGWDRGSRGLLLDVSDHSTHSAAWLAAYKAGHSAGEVARVVAYDRAATYAAEMLPPADWRTP